MIQSAPQTTSLNEAELADRLTCAIKTGNRNALLHVYVDYCKLNLLEKNYETAMFKLWKALSVMEFANDDRLKMETLDLCLALIPFLHEYEDFQFLIEANLAIENETNYDIVSNSYFILSMIFLQQNELENAYRFAKMAYYFAQKLPEEQQVLYLCNAQLQLTFIALINKRFDEVDNYINRFNWQLENCQTHQEFPLIQTVHFVKECLLHQFNVELFNELKNRLTNSNVKFYPVYLAIVLQKIFAFHGSEIIQQRVNEWAIDLKKSSDFNLKSFLENNKAFMKRKYMNSELYFEKAEELFVKARAQKQRIYLIHFEAINASRALVNHLIFEDSHIEHIIHRYLDSTLVIVFEEKYKPYFDKLFEKYSGHYFIINEVVSQDHHRRFFDLHNLKRMNEKR